MQNTRQKDKKVFKLISYPLKHNKHFQGCITNCREPSSLPQRRKCRHTPRRRYKYLTVQRADCAEQGVFHLPASHLSFPEPWRGQHNTLSHGYQQRPNACPAFAPQRRGRLRAARPPAHPPRASPLPPAGRLLLSSREILTQKRFRRKGRRL